MPIYEHYCPDCHVIFNFYSRSIQSTKRPTCPRCHREGLDRVVSRFAVVGRAKEKTEGDAPKDLPFNEAAMEQALTSMASELENVDEEDPRQAARLMRKFGDKTGMQFGSTMEEALNRMEAGEDPEAIEAELGDLLEKEDPFKMDEAGQTERERLKTRRPAPARDDTLYEL